MTPTEQTADRKTRYSWPLIFLPFILLFIPLAILPLHLIQIGHLHDWAAFSNERGGVTWYIWLVLVPMTVAGSWLLYRLPSAAFSRVSAKMVVAGAILLALPLFFAPPVLSTDVYHSLFYGENMALGLNPYRTTLSDRPDSVYAPAVFFVYQHWPSPYGPLWLQLMRASVSTFHAIGSKLFFLRSIMLLFHLVLAFVMGSLLVSDQAKRRKIVTLLAWSPALLIFGVSEIHPDTIIGSIIAIAAWAAVRRKIGLTIFLITVAGLLKPTALIMMPLVFLWYLTAEGRKAIPRLLRSCIFPAVLTLVVVSPLWVGTKTFDGIRQQAKLMSTTYVHTPLSFFLSGYSNTRSARGQHVIPDQFISNRIISQPISYVTLPQPAVRGAKALSLAAFLAIFFWLAVQLARKKATLLFAILSTLLAFTVFGVQWYMSWYILWVLPFVVAEYRIAKLATIYLIALIPALFYQPVLGMIFLGFGAGFINALLHTFRKDARREKSVLPRATT